MSSKTMLAALAATTMLAGGAAFAADGTDTSGATQTPPPGHAAVVKDFRKLSADGVRAYQDIALARLAIFDGRTADAKKYVDDADAGFNKAKGDESVFTQAEATMRTHMTKAGQGAGSSQQPSSSASASADGKATNGGDVNKPIAWLPVDGTVTINEDYSLQPAKAKAVAEANKSLAQGDRKGAMEKLKLAEVDTAVSLALVPLNQTIGDVDQAKQLIESGKFYEGSQKLRAVQDATVFTIADMPATMAKGQNGGGQGSAKPATP